MVTMYLRNRKISFFVLFFFFLFFAGKFISQGQAGDGIFELDEDLLKLQSASDTKNSLKLPKKVSDLPTEYSFDKSLFNEYIFNEDKETLQKLAQQTMNEIESNWRKNTKCFVLNMQAQGLYHKITIDMLVLDYVLACRASINSMLEQLESQIKHRPGTSLKKYKTFLTTAKINLGSMFLARYPCSREKTGTWPKGEVQSLACVDNWGVISFPPPDYTMHFTTMCWLQKKAKKDNEVAKDVLEVYGKVCETLGFISQPADVVMFCKGVDYYRKKLSEIFGSHTRFTPITVCSVIFDINSECQEREERRNNTNVVMLATKKVLEKEDEYKREGEIGSESNLSPSKMNFSVSLPIFIPNPNQDLSSDKSPFKFEKQVSPLTRNFSRIDEFD